MMKPDFKNILSRALVLCNQRNEKHTNNIPFNQTGYNVLHFPRIGGDEDIT